MPDVSSHLEPRDRILAAALALLEESGRGAVSTRAVSSRADVQPQTIYRQFGDMASLLSAVAGEGFDLYLTSKSSRVQKSHAIDDLRAGWDLHVDFAIEHPALFVLMYGEPQPGRGGESAKRADQMLRDLVSAIARAGRLTVDVVLAASMIQSASTGVALTIIADGIGRHVDLSASVREAVISAITNGDPSGTGDAVAPDAPAHAISLRSQLESAEFGLTTGEKCLLDELLEQIGSGPRRESSKESNSPVPAGSAGETEHRRNIVTRRNGGAQPNV